MTNSSAEAVAALSGMFIFGLIGLVYLFFMALMVFLIVFWILMLIDAIKRDYAKQDEKIVWIIVLALTGWLGALIYYFMVKRKDPKPR